MRATKQQAVELGRRSTEGLHHLAESVEHASGAVERTAGRLARATDQVDRIDARSLSDAWDVARRPRRRTGRLLAVLVVGALAAVAVSRLWRHVLRRTAATGGNLEWHVDRDDGNWQVVDSRRERPVSTHRTQAEAVAAAEHSLADEGGGTVVVHALDGHPRESRHVEPAVGNGQRA